MSTHSLCCDDRSLDHLANSLRIWRIALAAYAALAVFAAGWLSATAVGILLFAGFSAMALFVFRLKARIASLRMERHLEALGAISRGS